MHRQRAHVAAILHQLGHAFGKAAHVGLATTAGHRQRAVFDDIERALRHIDDLAPLGHYGLCQRQRAATARALARQRMVDGFGRFGCALERAALVATLGTWLVA
jgi:hypothetical protein